ncbi:MAG: hypothetical protein AAGH43_13515 [Pseudomonadota bacterium]
MFDRGILFVGSGGVGVGLLAEALALDAIKRLPEPMPVRVYSATLNESAEADPVLLRAMRRLNLDTSASALKPLALYGFAGAPRIDHVIALGTALPPAQKLALGDGVDFRQWSFNELKAVEKAPGETEGDRAPGSRYLGYVSLAESLRQPIRTLMQDVTRLDGIDEHSLAETG